MRSSLFTWRGQVERSRNFVLVLANWCIPNKENDLEVCGSGLIYVTDNQASMCLTACLEKALPPFLFSSDANLYFTIVIENQIEWRAAAKLN